MNAEQRKPTDLHIAAVKANDNVYDISDRFVILDRGEVVHQLDKKDIATPEELMKIMRDTIKKH